MRNKHPLYTFIHRTLIFRLFIVGLLLCLLIGSAVLFIERDRVSQEVINLSVNQLANFTHRYDYLFTDANSLETKKIHQAVKEFGSSKVLQRLGSFVYATIYDIQGNIVTEHFNDRHGVLKEITKKNQSIHFNQQEEDFQQYKAIVVNGRPLLEITLPLINKNKNQVAAIRAFFLFSEETIKASRLRGLKSMFFAVMIILITTAILYPVVLRLAGHLSRFSEQILQANLDTIEILGSAIALRDGDTNAHSYRVTIYAVRIGENVGLSHQRMRKLIKGALLHDVGKIGIPDTILRKPGKLTEAEYETIKTHVELGDQLVKRSTWLNDALEVVFAHHEKISGDGYPLGIAGENIPITARIFAIADVFDALTSKRPYKEAIPFEQTLEEMQKRRGSHFDPFLLEAFMKIAEPLHKKLKGKEEFLQKELAGIIKKYFHEEISDLLY